MHIRDMVLFDKHEFVEYIPVLSGGRGQGSDARQLAVLLDPMTTQ